MNITKRLIVSWGTVRPDGRRFKVYRNRRVSSVYIQIGRLEVVGWYR